MATHSSIFAWRIPGTGEPGGLQSMGSPRVGHLLRVFTFTFMYWRRKWKPTPVFLPGESQVQGSLVGCRLWGRTVSDMTEATQQQQQSGTFQSSLVLSFILTLSLAVFPQIMGPLEFCAHGGLQMLHVNGGKSSAQAHALLSYKLKDKVKNFKTVTTGH